MGRKIPGKKHRGIKDPLKQRAKRLAELETKINAPPKDEEQAVPKSLERVIQLKEAVKAGKVSKKARSGKRKKEHLISVGGPTSERLHPKAKPEKIIPVFKQKPGESGHAFYHRVCRLTQNFLNEAAFEKRYNVSIDRNPETGKVEGLSRCASGDLGELERLKAKHKNIKKKKKLLEADGTPKLSKTEKRKKKLEIKKKRKLEDNVDEFDNLKDVVKFGEVVHAPPQLKARPRKADSANVSKPGRKSLLLNTLFVENESSKDTSTKSPSFDRSGKRKNLPVGERRQLEEQQRNVIAAYRNLKGQHFKTA